LPSDCVLRPPTLIFNRICDWERITEKVSILVTDVSTGVDEKVSGNGCEYFESDCARVYRVVPLRSLRWVLLLFEPVG
jgi:hypothetical protein